MRKLLWIPAVLCGVVAIYGASDLIQAPDGSKVMALLVLLAITFALVKVATMKRKKKSAPPKEGNAPRQVASKADALPDLPAVQAEKIPVAPVPSSDGSSTQTQQEEEKTMQPSIPINISIQVTPPARRDCDEDANKRPMKGESILKPISYYVALDIETTGFSPSDDEIIELSAIRVHDNEVVDQFTSLVRPSQPVSERITELTGITNEMLADAPLIDQVLPAFRTFIGNYPLIGHNVNFDINFLYDNSLRLGLDAVTNDYLDTMRLSRNLYPAEKHHRLSDLVARFGIGDSVAHRAMSDVMQTKACYDVMRVALKESNPKAFPDASEGVPGAMDDYFRGDELRKAGDIEGALALFDAAKSKGYESPGLYIGYAMAYRKQKDYQAEIDVLKTGIASMEARHWPTDKLLERMEKTEQMLAREQSALAAAQEKARAKEAKRKAREEIAGEESEAKATRKRAILQMDMDKQLIRRFDSISDAVRETGVNAKSIRDAANGKQSHAGGFKWQYDD